MSPQGPYYAGTAASATASAPTVAQIKQNATSSSASSLATQFSSNTTAGNCIVVCINTYSHSVSSITDSDGNSYSKIVSRSTYGDTEVWYARNILGGSNTNVTVTLGSSDNFTVQTYELANVGHLPLDSSGATNGDGSTNNDPSMSLTTSYANELIIVTGAKISASGTDTFSAAGSGANFQGTNSTPTTSNVVSSGSETVSEASSGSHSVSFTISTLSSTWQIAAVSFIGLGGGVAWSNPSNATSAPDATYTTATLAASAQTSELQLTNFGFSIPSTAIVDGIYVEFERYGGVVTQSIQLLKAGTGTGNIHGDQSGSGDYTDNWPSTTETFAGYGSGTDLWGTTWLYSDVNNANFGVQLAAINTTGGSLTGYVDAVRITVYWHTVPATVPLEYVYKVYSSTGTYLGNLPAVVSKYQVSQDINTTGTTLPVVCAVTPDTSAQAVSDLTDESGNALTDESGNALTTDGQPPIVSLGGGPQALVQNGNRVQVWEYTYWHPNGTCVFKGEIQRWEANFGGGGAGSGGAATSDTSSHTIQLLLYSDGSDLANYMSLSQSVLDQQQTSTNATTTVNFSSSYPPPGQAVAPGAGVTGVGRIRLLLASVNGDNPTVTVGLYASRNALANLIVYAAQSVAPDATASQVITSTTPQTYDFIFDYSFPSTAPGYYIFQVVCEDVHGVILSYDNTASIYPYNILGVNGSVGAMYFETFNNGAATNPTYTTIDPANMMLNAVINYGGYVSVSTSSVESTGLSVSYEFNTNTVLEVINAVMQVSPPNFYYYVNLGTSVLYYKAANTVPDVTFTKGVHLEQATIIGSIENIVNTAFFTGGIPTGQTNSIYTTYTDATSYNRYGPHLDRPTDSNVTDLPTGSIVAYEDVQTQKNEQNQTSITIMYPNYDVSLLYPGLMVGFNGFGTFIDNLLLQIVRVDRTPEYATLTLGNLPKRVIPSIEEIVRSLVGQQTITNPSTPGFSL